MKQLKYCTEEEVLDKMKEMNWSRLRAIAYFGRIRKDKILPVKKNTTEEQPQRQLLIRNTHNEIVTYKRNNKTGIYEVYSVDYRDE